jgi:hypothetical protein
MAANADLLTSGCTAAQLIRVRDAAGSDILAMGDGTLDRSAEAGGGIAHDLDQWHATLQGTMEYWRGWRFCDTLFHTNADQTRVDPEPFERSSRPAEAPADRSFGDEMESNQGSTKNDLDLLCVLASIRLNERHLRIVLQDSMKNSARGGWAKSGSRHLQITVLHERFHEYGQ